MYVHFQPAIYCPCAQTKGLLNNSVSAMAGKKQIQRKTSETYHKHQNSFACSGGHKTIVWIRNERSSHMCKPHVENYAKIAQMRATFNTWLPSAAARTQGYQQLVILRYL